MSEIKDELQVGKKAPTFKLKNQKEELVDLKDFKGQTVVLYFYPKDDTPGCTTQACGIRDGYGEIKKLNVKLFGLSPDSPKSHQKFIDKFELPFDLLSDEEKTVSQAYNVWVEKSMYGKKYMGVERSTFIIDAEGKLAAIFRKVKPDEHLDLVIDFFKKN
jgi:peroxiredoxin Q/BCP